MEEEETEKETEEEQEERRSRGDLVAACFACPRMVRQRGTDRCTLGMRSWYWMGEFVLACVRACLSGYIALCWECCVLLLLLALLLYVDVVFAAPTRTAVCCMIQVDCTSSVIHTTAVCCLLYDLCCYYRTVVCVLSSHYAVGV